MSTNNKQSLMSQEDWHLSKTITVGNIIASIIALSALIGSYYTLDKRLSLVEANDAATMATINKITEDRRNDAMILINRLDRIEDLIMKVHFKEVPSSAN